MRAKQFHSFTDFWPYYLSEHARPATRALHAIGTMLGVACLLTLIAKGKWIWLPLALAPGYGFAWFAHFFIEKNKPATFRYPLWSFIADYKMIGMIVAGRINEEVKRVMSNDRKPIA
jgi:hypothetical protein